MTMKFTNNASADLAVPINASATSILVQAGTGVRFPALGSGDYFFATLIDQVNNLEIVRVTARSGDTLTVVRGQDGTTARSYAAGDRIELRIVAAGLNTFAKLDAAQTFTGVNTFDSNAVFNSGMDVAANSSGQAFGVRGRAIDGLGTLQFYANDGVTATGQVQSRSDELRVQANGARAVTFYTNGSDRGRFDSAGRFAVGTQSPAAQFHANQSNPTRGIVGIIGNSASSGQTGAQLQFAQSGIADWVIGQPAATNALVIWRARNPSADGAEVMRFDSASNAIFGAGVQIVENRWSSGSLEGNAIYTTPANPNGFGFGNGSTLSSWWVKSAANGLRRAVECHNDGTRVALRTNNEDRVVVNQSGQLLTAITGGSTLMEDYGCRAWVNFNGSSASINAGGNVSSISRLGVGNYQVNLATAMPDTNYTVNLSCASPTYVDMLNIFDFPNGNYIAPTTTSFRFTVYGQSAYRDPIHAMLSIFR